MVTMKVRLTMKNEVVNENEAGVEDDQTENDD